MPVDIKETAAEIAYIKARALSKTVKGFAADQIALLQTETNADRPESIGRMLNEFINQFDVLKAVPGIGQYAKDHLKNTGYDAASEYQSLISAMSSTCTAILSFMWVDGDGYVTIYKLNSDFSKTFRVMTQAERNGLSSKLGSIVSSIGS